MSNHLYQNKYRIQSARLSGHNYRTAGYYFITVCTHRRQHYFGHIKNKIMHLNKMGKIADRCWQQIPQHFPLSISHIHVIMPNHMHGILEIINNPSMSYSMINKRDTSNSNINAMATRTDVACNVYTMSQISPKPHSLPIIIRSYKTACTNNICQTNPDFRWQSLYHDHIIRNQIEYEKIYAYIQNNPVLWNRDRNNGIR
ncbi:MAG: transposase [Patescibacteria group bacterium]